MVVSAAVGGIEAVVIVAKRISDPGVEFDKCVTFWLGLLDGTA